MKPQIKPVAMPCETPERAKEMTELCEKHGIVVENKWAESNCVFTNNRMGFLGRVSFIFKDLKEDYNRTLIPYHPELFMYNSGVFPEKWAVRDTNGLQEILGSAWKNNHFTDSLCYREDGDTNGGYHFLMNNNLSFSYDIPTDYVEVTLEELMFHYEQKTDMKKVKCVKPSGNIFITIGVEYLVIKEDESEYLIKANDGSERYYRKSFFEVATTQQPTLKLTITRTELLEIHKVACPTWQINISKYGKRLDLVTDTITFTELEVNEMFKAATTYNGVNQKEVLERIFGNPLKAQLLAEKEELKNRIEEIERELKK